MVSAGLSPRNAPACRFCGSPLHHTFVDLGMSPLANSYLSPEQLNQAEPFYPLHARVCDRCFLVQVDEFGGPEAIFTDYAYFSSFSSSWLKHAEDYVRMMVSRFGVASGNLVVEIASNDGYLLQYFRDRKIDVLGIEPAQNVAKAAQEKGTPTISKFFGLATAQELTASGKQADVIVANNVLAHVPGLVDFVSGLQCLLKPGGVLTLEFPHLLRLIESNQFDTIYHEHFSYFSFCTVEKIFASRGLTIFDVEELPTHGGSLRVFCCHAGASDRQATDRIAQLRESEIAAGILKLDTYCRFAEQVKETKRSLLSLLIEIKRQGKSIVGYGAPAKGNTLLNYCGIGRDFLDYTVDMSPHKQGHFLPGTHIPIYAPEQIHRTRPDYVLILPWNLRDEIIGQLAEIRQWGGKFILPIPKAEIVS